MNLLTAQSKFPRDIRVRVGHEGRYGVVRLLRANERDRYQSEALVVIDGHQEQWIDTEALHPIEGTFRCEFCRHRKPHSKKTKLYGLSKPDCCEDCRSQGQRFVLRTSAARRAL